MTVDGSTSCEHVVVIRTRKCRLVKYFTFSISAGFVFLFWIYGRMDAFKFVHVDALDL